MGLTPGVLDRIGGVQAVAQLSQRHGGDGAGMGVPTDQGRVEVDDDGGVQERERDGVRASLAGSSDPRPRIVREVTDRCRLLVAVPVPRDAINRGKGCIRLGEVVDTNETRRVRPGCVRDEVRHRMAMAGHYKLSPCSTRRMTSALSLRSCRWLITVSTRSSVAHLCYRRTPEFVTPGLFGRRRIVGAMRRNAGHAIDRHIKQRGNLGGQPPVSSSCALDTDHRGEQPCAGHQPHSRGRV